MDLESPESPTESPESPSERQQIPTKSPESPSESPESPSESPESPTENEKEEVLFVEDRRPGFATPFSFELRHKPTPEVIQEPEQFIRLSDNDKPVAERNTIADELDGTKCEEPRLTSNQTARLPDDILFIMEDRNPQLTGQAVQSPRYNINESFLKLQDQGTVAKRKNKLANTCWNCGETTHSLRECPEPRDHVTIARNRREFQESKPVMPAYRRYHVDEGQRLAHLAPGQLSNALRRALGLDARELPGHIYMMRQLGYPPGWLAEACVSHSGISMFDGQGNQVAEPGSEAGEITEKGSLDKYDIRKIHHFPGFNVPPPPDTYDDSGYYKVPPLSRQQSIEVMLERLHGRFVGGYKRKKLSLDVTGSADDSQSANSQDMDYEETPEGAELPEDNCKFVPPLPDEEVLPPPPPTELPPEPLDTDSQSQSTSMDGSSLLELEEEKRNLLAQLNDVSPSCSTPQSKIGKVKTVDFGTPILKSVSPYARLPSSEKFSVDICDVINFENLPDSTGKYEKMSGLIRKVRSKLSHMNST